MRKLTDLEICQKIADIVGVYYIETKYYETDNFLGLVNKPDGSGTPPELIGEFNPLTDDALIFNLAFENKVEIDYFDECVYIPLKRKVFRFSFKKDDINSLRRAICLVIIESHERA